MLVYASPPVSGGETQRFAKAAHLCPEKVRSRGRLATFRKMQSPVALELLELLARSHIPQPDAVVVSGNTPAARSEHGAVERESDVVDLVTVLVL